MEILKSQLLNARNGAVEVPFPLLLDNDVDLCSTHVYFVVETSLV